MLQKCRKMLRNEKGLTLIELLAVVVILGIIAAIAIPSIGNIIEKSRNDAHVANAQQVVNAARLAATSESSLSVGTKYISLEFLLQAGYLEKIQDPDDKSNSYTTGGANTLELTSALNSAPTSSYVQLTEGKPTEVKIFASKKKVEATASNGNLNINNTAVTANP
ncbi:prepilin-type N-terminal cleavage/methylation domain-containing protein [Bacillus sp. LL01]|uniref:type II secretion system protein n=1 Tax=Bacillus sp. LL01 TaxID=1665556 RepID=UPI00069EEAB8|nr:prepilin-type N-terminal cleavage/methylation domain-containing protein [Bacillus sp. LL01]